ncbi:hypothetical protein Tco_1105338 [Tanacetum coccineum]
MSHFTAPLAQISKQALEKDAKTNTPCGDRYHREWPLKALLGSISDNAFQKILVVKDWKVGHRVASVVVGWYKACWCLTILFKTIKFEDDNAWTFLILIASKLNCLSNA